MRGDRLRHGLSGGNGAGFQRDDNGVDGVGDAVGRDADELHRAHAAANEGVGEIGRPREVVGDGSEQQRHICSLIVSRGAVRAAFRQARPRYECE